MEPGSLADRGVIEPAGALADALSALAAQHTDQVRATEMGTGGERIGADNGWLSSDGGAGILVPRARS